MRLALALSLPQVWRSLLLALLALVWLLPVPAVGATTFDIPAYRQLLTEAAGRLRLTRARRRRLPASWSRSRR